MKKALARMHSLFVLVSIFLFAFLVFDLSLSYIPVYNTASGIYSIQPVISLLPVLPNPLI